MRLQASISPHSRTKAGCEPKSVSWRCGSQTAAGELDNRTWRHAAFRTGGGRHGRAAPVLFHRLAEDAVPPLQGGLRALAGTRYTNKMPLTAVHLLDTDVVPFFVGHGVPVKTRAVGHGRDLRSACPPALRAVSRARTHRTSQDYGATASSERHRRTLPSPPLDEHFRVEGRRTWFETVDQSVRSHPPGAPKAPAKASITP